MFNPWNAHLHAYNDWLRFSSGDHCGIGHLRSSEIQESKYLSLKVERPVRSQALFCREEPQFKLDEVAIERWRDSNLVDIVI